MFIPDSRVKAHLKGTKKFGSTVINGQLFYRKTVFHIKILSITKFTTKLRSIKDCFLNGPKRKITKKFAKKLNSKFIN